ncbi:MAG: hypothetical protein QXW39_09215, partial [Candidatus Bathyarchaeia archaeon]
MNEIYKLLRIVGGRRKVPESELKRLLGIKEVDVMKVEWGNTMGIHLEVVELLAKKNLKKLLLLEKKKRGVGEDELVFVGMANVSSYYWCAAKSLLISKAEELKFFHAYLYDRILYSKELGLIDKIPSGDGELLEVGSNISFEDIERLLQRRKVEKSDVEAFEVTKFQDVRGNRILVVEDLTVLTPEVLQGVKKIAIPDYIKVEEVVKVLKSLEKGRVPEVEIVSLDEYPVYRGEVLQRRRAEKYPTIRWNFEWEDYVVVGVPDGITDSFVYEFKTTRSPFLLNYVKPVAFTQADLYGYFFRRGMKRVQIYVTETEETITWVEKVDEGNAEET